MNRELLVQTLEAIKPALSKSYTVPIFQCFTFADGMVMGYDDTVAITGPVDFEGECGIHGNTLLGLLSNTKAAEVDIKLEGTTAFIKAGKTVSKLPFEPPESFIFEEPKAEWDFKIQYIDSFHEALTLCLETVSSDETQPALHGVTIKGDHLYSCNGDTITRVKIKQKGKYQILLSTQFCEAVSRLWTSMQMTKGTLSVSKDWVMVEFPDWTVYGRVLEIKSPLDFEALIKRTIQADMDMQPVPEELAEALARARVIADSESSRTSLTIKKGKMDLHTENFLGEVNDTVPFKDHPDITTNVNAAHIQRALEHCDQVAVHENCTVFRKGDDVFQLVSNMG